jgi:hypothetical protein
MPTIINHNPPADDENTLYLRRCAEVDKAVRLEAAVRGLPPESWPLPSADGAR